MAYTVKDLNKGDAFVIGAPNLHNVVEVRKIVSIGDESILVLKKVKIARIGWRTIRLGMTFWGFLKWANSNHAIKIESEESKQINIFNDTQ